MNLTNDKALGRKLKALSAVAGPEITRRALNKSMDKIHKDTVDKLVQLKNLPRRNLLTSDRGRRGRLRKYPATRKVLRARVWIGLKRRFITASEMGLSEGGPIRAKNRRFPNAFRATMPNGVTGLFARKVPESINKGGRDRKGRLKKGRLPIARGLVDLMPEAQSILAAEARFHKRRTLPDEMRRLLRVRARQIAARRARAS